MNNQTATVNEMKNKQESNTIIPRKILFGNPERAAVQVSPDGKYLSYLAPHNGVLNIFVAPVDDPNAAKVVTDDTKRGVRNQLWAFDNTHILYLKDKDGDENWNLYSVDVNTAENKNLTDYKDTRVEIIQVSHLHPNEIIIGLNNRVPEFFDIYKLNLQDGSTALLYQNNEFASITLDDNYTLRLAQKIDEEGNAIIQKFDENQNLLPLMIIGADDLYTTSIIDFDKSGEYAYMLDSIDRNTAAISKLHLASNTKEVLYSNDKADISGIGLHPTEKTIQAFSYNYLRREVTCVDEAFKSDFEYLKSKIAQGDLSIISSSLDDNVWIVADLRDDGPVSYYRYDRKTKGTFFLFTNKSDLVSYKLNRMYPVAIQSQDGLDLVSYLTVPNNIQFDSEKLTSTNPVPLVIWVHGGPTARDAWGYSAVHQWLSNRGYAVLSVNYRGSTGFGKNFINAGNGEWGKKAHTDLIDAAQWAIKQGITTSHTIAIGGGSYGGYAALAGLTFSPDVFACAIDIVGPSNLATLLETIPPYWKPMLSALERKIGGNITTDEGKAVLYAASPINFLDNIQRPLLVAHGANDPRVKQAESDQIVSLMQSKNIPVSYVLYPEEGHGFAKPENSISFFAIAEAFLGEQLHGVVEPVGTDFEGANFVIQAGKEFLHNINNDK